jgi:UMF1 family MFS transporter
MTRPKWLNREVFGWAMFDFANQAFTLVILTTLFQIYFINEIVVNDDSRGRQLWATAGIISLLIVIVVSPLIGALADFSGAKKKLLFIAYSVSVVLTAALGLATPGQVTLAMTIFIVGYVFYGIGENFMGSFLPELAAPKDMGKVSAFGWTLGYTGGLLCLFGGAVLTRLYEGPTGFRLTCLWAGVFYGVGGLPTFLLLREKKKPEQMPPNSNVVTVGFKRMVATFRDMQHYGHLFRFLMIMTVYMGGMQIVIWFAGSIGTKIFGLSDQELAIYILVLTVSAIIGASCTGLMQDRIGTKRTIVLGLVVWLLVMLTIPFMRPEPQYKFMFWILGTGVGVGMGVLGTSTRAMVGLFSPPHKAAEFFGFYGLGMKLAAVAALTLSIVAEAIWPDNYNMVVGSSAIFFIVGIVLMLFVDEQGGRQACADALQRHVAKHHDYNGPAK